MIVLVLFLIIFVCSVLLYFINKESFASNMKMMGATVRRSNSHASETAIRDPLEKFINDYYDKYEGDLSVNPSFYDNSLVLPETHYLFEMNDRFFINALNSVKVESELYPIKKMGKLLSTIEREQLLKKIDTYLLNLLNSKLPSTEKFIYNSINSNIQEAIEYNKSIIANTNHIVYRDTKAYGESITLTTLYEKDKITGILNYKFNGLIFEDKIQSYQPVNLDDNKYQDYRKDNIVIYDENYEKTYLCKLYNDIYKYRGLKVSNNLDC